MEPFIETFSERIGNMIAGSGMNQCSLGREGAREGIMEYLETKLGGFVI